MTALHTQIRKANKALLKQPILTITETHIVPIHALTKLTAPPQIPIPPAAKEHYAQINEIHLKQIPKTLPIPATHTLTCLNTHNPIHTWLTPHDITDPNQEVATIIYLKPGRLIGRKGTTAKIIAHNQNAYYHLTWLDVIGFTLPGGRELTTYHQNRKILYLQTIPPHIHQLIIDANPLNKLED